MSTLFWLALLGAAVWLWQDQLRTRERANALARETCQREGVQLLDGTVAMTRLVPRWTRNGLRFRRTFVFDYSRDGVDRLQGFVVITGRRVESIGLAEGLGTDQAGF